MKQIIQAAIRFSKERLKNSYDGHDYYHAERVYKKAIHIAEKEGANIFLTGMAAILHDVDNKLVLNIDENPDDCTVVRDFLQSLAMDIKDIDFICDIINFVANRPAAYHMRKTKEAMAVNDANNLDSIGAIGIARAFAYGAIIKQTMYTGEVNDDNTIKYFYDRLLPMGESMLTETGKELAKDRLAYMDSFIHQFYYEWTL